jgi:HD-like signal output (HDOD) protein
VTISKQDQRANQLINRIDEFPPLPTFVARIMQLNADPESSLEDISRVVEAEVALSVSLLKMVNSPLLGLAQKVSSISRAIAVLGRNELMTLILTSAMFQTYKGFNQKKGHINALGSHSFKCALTARYLGEKTGNQGSGLFLAGLVHDIGKNIIFLNVSDQELEDLYPEEVDPQAALAHEVEHLGISHDVLGSRLLASWTFPLFLQVSAEYHHQPEMAPQQHALYPLLIHAADNLVILLDSEIDDPQELAELYQRLFTRERLQLLALFIPRSGIIRSSCSFLHPDVSAKHFYPPDRPGHGWL